MLIVAFLPSDPTDLRAKIYVISSRGIGQGSIMANLIADRLKTISPLFVVTVAVPTLISAVYFGLIASDVYISESRFVVRSPDKQSQSPLGALLRAPGVAAAGDEIYAVQEYIESRDALKALDKNGGLRSAYSRKNIDPFSRFGGISSQSFEDLYRYYGNRIDVKHEASSSITTMRIRAYAAKDAYVINERLLELSEALVNRLSDRSRDDLIRFASNEVANAEKSAQSAAIALSRFRNAQGILDPERQATVQLQLVSKLQDELISTKTQLLQLKAFTPSNPQIPVLQTRVQGLGKEIENEIHKIAGDQGSLAGAAVQFQRLSLESQFADKQLTSAMASLEEARNEARRKQVYLERIVQPNVPDAPLEPRRWRNILSTFVIGLVCWGILSMLLAGVREHQD